MCSLSIGVLPCRGPEAGRRDGGFMSYVLKVAAMAIGAALACHYPLYAFAAACGPPTDYFRLACRGPLEHRILWDAGPPPAQVETITVEWTFADNAEAAGPTGQSLQPGTCAWEDRPVASAEPHVLRTEVHRFLGRQVFHEALLTCSNDRRCVIFICATNKQQFLSQYYGLIEIKFPAGLSP